MWRSLFLHQSSIHPLKLVCISGEDALANLSIERGDGPITGHIRIRSKTQGIALSLGKSQRIVVYDRYIIRRIFLNYNVMWYFLNHR